MNPLASTNTLLLLLSLVILILNIGVSAFRVWRGNARAGWFNVILALAACALLTIGLFRITFPFLAGEPAASSANPGLAASNQQLITSMLIGMAGIVLGGLLLLIVERRRPGFEPSASPGILYLGAGIFALVAIALVPTLPSQFTVARARGPQFAGVASNGLLATRVMPETSTTTVTPVPSGTPTALPTLTETPNASVTPLFTAVAYAYSNASTAVACSIMAQTTINLRGDPSVERQAVGRVFAGSLLQVTGRTTDKKWWRVINTDGGVSVEGWVSANYVAVGSTCDAALVLGANNATVAPSTLTQSAALSAATKAPAASSTPAAKVHSCTLTITSSVSLRPDPSRSREPLAQILEGAKVTAIGKSADGLWWQVNYTAGDKPLVGWVGGGAVMAPSACKGLPVVEPTPAS